MMEFIESVARRAGTEAMKYFKHEKTNRISSKKTVKDLVSTADKAVEKVIIDAIRERYPEHDIYGEESGRSGASSEYCWVIDPIDGTQSFVKNHPYCPLQDNKTTGFAGMFSQSSDSSCK